MKRYNILLLCCILCFPSFFAAAPVDVAKGGVRVVLDDHSGSAALFIRESSGRSVPLLAPYGNFTSSFFSIRTGSRIYHLNRASMSDMTARASADGAEMLYMLPGGLSASVSFVFVPLGTEGAGRALRIDVSVNNASADTCEIELRGLFDTYLGENTGVHFTTAARPKIETETLLENIENEKWICSSDGSRSLYLVFQSADISVPQCVWLGNKDTVGSVWNVSAKEGRPFDSLRSYNNSAVAVYWKPAELKPGESVSVSFYAVPGLGDALPDLDGLMDHGYVPQDTENHLAPSFVFSAAVSEGKPDPAYLKALAERIRALLDSPAAADAEEVRRLNAEVSAVFDYLRESGGSDR